MSTLLARRAARKGGFDDGFDIVALKVPSGRVSPYWFYLPGPALLALVWWRQGRHLRPERASIPRPERARSVRPEVSKGLPA